MLIQHQFFCRVPVAQRGLGWAVLVAAIALAAVSTWGITAIRWDASPGIFGVLCSVGLVFSGAYWAFARHLVIVDCQADRFELWMLWGPARVLLVSRPTSAVQRVCGVHGPTGEAWLLIGLTDGSSIRIPACSNVSELERLLVQPAQRLTSSALPKP